MSDRKRAPKTHIADSQEEPKTPPFSLGKTAPAKAKPGVSEKRQVNQVTWRLIDPDAPHLLLQASHGQWGGYQYPKALAYVFDVGVNDWRIRVRLRGNQWRAWGSIIDFATAKHIAQQAVENSTEPRPSKFNIPLNLIGGERRRPGAPTLDSQTRGYIQHVESGAVKVDAPNEQPTPGDDESINLCASNSELEAQRAKDLVDESLDESLYPQTELVAGNYARQPRADEDGA